MGEMSVGIIYPFPHLKVQQDYSLESRLTVNQTIGPISCFFYIFNNWSGSPPRFGTLPILEDHWSQANSPKSESLNQPYLVERPRLHWVVLLTTPQSLARARRTVPKGPLSNTSVAIVSYNNNPWVSSWLNQTPIIRTCWELHFRTTREISRDFWMTEEVTKKKTTSQRRQFEILIHRIDNRK